MGGWVHLIFNAVNYYQSPLSNLVSFAPLPNYLYEFFQLIEFYNLLTVNKAWTEVLPSAIAHMAHLLN